MLGYFKKSPPVSPAGTKLEQQTKYRRLKWQVFLSATIGYGLYYVCRLSLNVVKKPIVDSGVLTESQLGIVGSALFFSYAVGKFTNGFLADHSNIRRFMSFGLLVSALANLAMGFTGVFLFFAICWGVNGWVQSMGAPSSVVSLSRWYTDKERGSFYGFWSTSHNIGEALTYILTAVVASYFGWQWGFRSAALIGIFGAVLIFMFFHDSPESKGLSPVNPETVTKKTTTWGEQKLALKNPYIWLLALSSGFMYISRYAVNSWGPYYFEAAKGYTLTEANSLVAISAVCGILGTASSGFISDKFFKGHRNMPALLYGLMNVLGLSLFLLGPKGLWWIDALSMVIFGLAIGALICYLGGLMAVDIASKKASGAALGMVGIMSYAAAGIQDIASGFLIEGNKSVVNGETLYDFSSITIFWIGAAVLSVVFALFTWKKT
ncbi:MFS transporter [Allomuricauda sp. SCSIO 65647]|uniref:MFS transporter n=1 Tax=Allomuricauda sp. SCSIO 65647 TaxID=2908843 RepID=UPI001F19F28C|nr:MFS transporter [Muricauda sp. SCSIO 65647]UJH66952.1 MFS transporter [Muricauda sp. SCSIO 65647]